MHKQIVTSWILTQKVLYLLFIRTVWCIHFRTHIRKDFAAFHLQHRSYNDTAYIGRTSCQISAPVRSWSSPEQIRMLLYDSILRYKILGNICKIKTNMVIREIFVIHIKLTGISICSLAVSTDLSCGVGFAVDFRLHRVHCVSWGYTLSHGEQPSL